MTISAGDELENISTLLGIFFVLHKNNVCILLSKKKLTNLWSQGKIGEFFQTEDQKSQPKISSKNPKIARKEHKKKQGKKANFVKIEKCKKNVFASPHPGSRHVQQLVEGVPGDWEEGVSEDLVSQGVGSRGGTSRVGEEEDKAKQSES